MLGGMLVAGFVALWLAGSVTGPVTAITRVARAVIERRDFTLRAARSTEDEIGVLVEAFNTMLAEVGQRASALQASNDALQIETAERREAEAALRVADQRKDEFLATLAHELRNPLAPMVNAVTLLQAGNANTSIVTQAQSMLERQLKQMVRLVNDLLDISRITSGKLAVRQRPPSSRPSCRTPPIRRAPSTMFASKYSRSNCRAIPSTFERTLFDSLRSFQIC